MLAGWKVRLNPRPYGKSMGSEIRDPVLFACYRLGMTQETPTYGPGPLAPPDINWQGGTLRSGRFGDVYFSKTDGHGETRHVFLDGITAPEIWQGRQRFTIGELGFGTGLNMLAAWDSWRRTAPPDARLHFVSVEGFPLSPHDMAAAHDRFPQLAELSRQLRAAYPRPVPGFHRLRLDGGRVALTLLYGPVEQMLDGLQARVDAWFLDGFAPSKNPDMWSEAVFSRIARLSVPGARVATFSAAVAVRQGLSAVGFAVEKRPGFGGKRECLAGRLQGAETEVFEAPWYAAPQPMVPGARIAVVGGGIAGRTAAKALTDEGFQTTVFDGSGADAQPERVLMSPRLADPDEPYGRFMAQAFVHAENRGGLPPAAGALHLPDEAEAERMAAFSDRLGWGHELAHPVDAAEASDLAGLCVQRGGLWFPHARFAAPSGVLQTDVRKARVMEAAGQGGEWALRLDDGTACRFDGVVFAAGPWSAGLTLNAGLDLRANRGQLCYLPATALSQRLRLPVSFGGHLSPVTGMKDGPGHVLGSSYGRWDLKKDTDGWRELDAGDRDGALAKLADVFPGLAGDWQNTQLKGWAGLRATTADHLPHVGPLADAAAYEEAYDGLHHGLRGDWPPAPYQPHAFVLSGLGSRGYQTGFLAAEILASIMAGAPLPVDREVTLALHPARMLVRRLRRPPEKRGRAV